MLLVRGFVKTFLIVTIKKTPYVVNMKIFRNIEDIGQPLMNVCVTIGNFDGVHRGHQRLFATVVEKARSINGTSVAITFDPHPLQILLPGGIKLISTCEQKEELIELSGIDVLLVIPFSKEFAKTTADTFVAELLVKKLGVKELVIGYDYAFGKGRSGNIEFLKHQGRLFDFPVTVVEACYIGKQLVSSTKIRELVKEKYGNDCAKKLPILYGGSCKPSNAAEIFSKPDVDGGLIGGAALKKEDFTAIVEAL